MRTQGAETENDRRDASLRDLLEAGPREGNTVAPSLALSGMIDALPTRGKEGRLVKVLAWSDSEWGHAKRIVELASMVASSLGPAHA